MDKAYHTKVLDDTIAQLKAQNIDAYLIVTSEGSDPMLPFLPGVGTVGSGAFMFTAGGRKIAVCTTIDAQDIEESGLFDEVRKYTGSYPDTMAQLLREFNPRRLAVNCSETDAFCDGLTMGRWRRLTEAVPEMQFELVSSDTFIPAVKNSNTRG